MKRNFIAATILTAVFGGVSASDLFWVNYHIRHGHSQRCDVYPQEAMFCTGSCEGDSPSFLWLVGANCGLNNPSDPTSESWGGKIKRDGEKPQFVDGPGQNSTSKWHAASPNEFTKRADWCVSHSGEKLI